MVLCCSIFHGVPSVLAGGVAGTAGAAGAGPGAGAAAAVVGRRKGERGRLYNNNKQHY